MLLITYSQIISIRTIDVTYCLKIFSTVTQVTIEMLRLVKDYAISCFLYNHPARHDYTVIPKQ